MNTGFLRNHICLICALFAGAVLRFGLILPAFSDLSRFSRPDTDGYLEMAEILAESGSFGNLTGRVPMLPAVFAFFICLAGKFWQYAAINFFVLISLATAFVVWLCAREFKKGCENVAVWLFVLNITSIANAPMLLTDTLFGLFAAVQTLFIFKFIKQQKSIYFTAAILVASTGTLLRPVNLLFPFCALFLLIPAKISLKAKFASGIAALMITGAVILPWMIRNSACGAGLTIDTNTGAMYHQNGAMLLAEVKNSDYEDEKIRLIQSMHKEFSDISRYPDEKSREAYRVKNYRKLIMEHPFIWFKQQLNFATLLPDAPTFLELTGATSPNRGTMGVLARNGVFAAVKHYFNGKYYLIILLLPLLVVSLVTAAGSAGFIISAFKKMDLELLNILLLFSLLIWYYLFLPGAISAPRYHIPALPCACTFAACFICNIKTRYFSGIKKQ